MKKYISLALVLFVSMSCGEYRDTTGSPYEAAANTEQSALNYFEQFFYREDETGPAKYSYLVGAESLLLSKIEVPKGELIATMEIFIYKEDGINRYTVKYSQGMRFDGTDSLENRRSTTLIGEWEIRNSNLVLKNFATGIASTITVGATEQKGILFRFETDLLAAGLKDKSVFFIKFNSTRGVRD